MELLILSFSAHFLFLKYFLVDFFFVFVFVRCVGFVWTKIMQSNHLKRVKLVGVIRESSFLCVRDRISSFSVIRCFRNV